MPTPECSARTRIKLLVAVGSGIFKDGRLPYMIPTPDMSERDKEKWIKHGILVPKADEASPKDDDNDRFGVVSPPQAGDQSVVSGRRQASASRKRQAKPVCAGAGQNLGELLRQAGV
jgi:hypothetical protein